MNGPLSATVRTSVMETFLYEYAGDPGSSPGVGTTFLPIVGNYSTGPVRNDKRTGSMGKYFFAHRIGVG